MYTFTLKMKTYMQTRIKNFAIILLSGIILISCKSAKELAMEGKYDKAFNKALGDLKKQPSNTESLGIMKLSFENANNQNLDQIDQLNAKNSPDRWDEIVRLYKSLQDRQDKMRQMLPFLSTSVQSSIKTYDYSLYLKNARRNAADYNYSRGIYLLDSNNKSNARASIDYFKKVKSYDPAYPEIDQLINEANFKAINHVLFLVNNYSYYNLSFSFASRMEQAANDPYLNSSWVRYYTVPSQNFKYDYVIELNLDYIRQIPERINTKSSVYTKTIDDGWEYEYDRRGNVKKDAQGNDIKHKKTKTIRCEVLEYTQTKSITIDAKLNYIHSGTNRIIRSIPIGLEQPFCYEYVVFRGDRAAVDRQVYAKLTKNERPSPFPSLTDMVYMAQDRFADIVNTALRDNDRLIRNSD